MQNDLADHLANLTTAQRAVYDLMAATLQRFTAADDEHALLITTEVVTALTEQGHYIVPAGEGLHYCRWLVAQQVPA